MRSSGRVPNLTWVCFYSIRKLDLATMTIPRRDLFYKKDYYDWTKTWSNSPAAARTSGHFVLRAFRAVPWSRSFCSNRSRLSLQSL